MPPHDGVYPQALSQKEPFFPPAASCQLFGYSKEKSG